MQKMIITLMTALLLTACDTAENSNAAEAAQPAPAEATQPAQAGAAKGPGPAATTSPAPLETKALIENIETAMAEIPPELREPFQKGFECYNKAEEAKYREMKQPRPQLTGADIRTITANLKASGGKPPVC